MNRRNFILGLGTAATLSGAASVTGASISGTADAGASFQVIAENDLNLQRNSDIDTADNGEILNSTSDNYVNTTVDFVGSDANPNEEGRLNTTQGSGLRDVDSPQLTVNGAQDSNLRIAVATPNEVIDDQDGTNDPYDTSNGGTSPLEIVNNGGSDKTISVEYTYGSSVDDTTGGNTRGDGNLDRGDVAKLFQFSIGGQQISPDPDSPASSGDEASTPNEATVTAGTSAKVDFSINYTSDIQSDIADNAGAPAGNYDFDEGAFTAVELLTQVSFGEVNST
ncbi:hypothetical protein HKK80_04240 [Halonotius sp. F2-221B]|uniref:hypothetical protein n=1 Tax=Halonotius sp. F2-221B TaxID=2731620 RepID=UPI00398B2A9E